MWVSKMNGESGDGSSYNFDAEELAIRLGTRVDKAGKLHAKMWVHQDTFEKHSFPLQKITHFQFAAENLPFLALQAAHRSHPDCRHDARGSSSAHVPGAYGILREDCHDPQLGTALEGRKTSTGHDRHGAAQGAQDHHQLRLYRRH